MCVFFSLLYGVCNIVEKKENYLNSQENIAPRVEED